MSLTYRIVNGQIDVNSATGQAVTVTGNRKCAQDMAESLLQDYDAQQQYGSYLRAIVMNRIPFGTEMLLRFYIAQAINLLQVKQQDDPYADAAERISQIDELLTTPNDSGVVGYFVSVSTEEGRTADSGAMVPTQLNQLTEGA